MLDSIGISCIHHYSVLELIVNNYYYAFECFEVTFIVD